MHGTHAGEYAATQSLRIDVTKETLDHVQPRCPGGGEVHGDARMFGQALLHDGVLVRGVVVCDQVQ